MTFLQMIFYVFAAILVVSSLLVVTVRNPVRAALFLVLAFFSAARTGLRTVTTNKLDTTKIAAKT